jgi:hypothetical protein
VTAAGHRRGQGGPAVVGGAVRQRAGEVGGGDLPTKEEEGRQRPEVSWGVMTAWKIGGAEW